jgi:hypothetical protein
MMFGWRKIRGRGEEEEEEEQKKKKKKKKRWCCRLDRMVGDAGILGCETAVLRAMYLCR